MNLYKKKTILLVEDEIVIATELLRKLERENYNVIHAADGESAIDIVCSKNENVDLILMDIILGKGIDGIEAANHILKKYAIPVLFLSSNISLIPDEKKAEVDSFNCMEKNSDFEALHASIKMAIKLLEAQQNNHSLEIQELQSAKDKLQLFIETINDVIFVLSPEGVITYASPVIERISGYKADLLINRPFTDFVFPEDLTGLLESFEHTVKGRLEPYECRMFNENGNLHHVRISSALISDKGAVTGIIGVLVDITDRKTAEEALRESEKKFRSYIENAPDGVFVMDGNGIFILSNDAAARITGYEKDEITGMSFVKLLYREDRAKTKKMFISVKESGNDLLESRFVKKNGEVRHGMLKGVKLSDNLYLGFASDVTDKVQAEEKIRNLLREKELILKEVHHRVKNNMYTIFSLLTIQADAQESPEMKKVLIDAAGRVQSMGVLYDRLYRLEDNTSVSMNEYLPELINQITDIFPGKKSMSIDISIEEINLNPKILSSVGIIFNEMITNSMKYAFSGINERYIKVTASEKGNSIHLTYEDSGSGIPVSVTFENSTGFGMQLIDMLVKQINGTISIDMEKRSRFIIEFPADTNITL